MRVSTKVRVGVRGKGWRSKSEGKWRSKSRSRSKWVRENKEEVKRGSMLMVVGEGRRKKNGGRG